MKRTPLAPMSKKRRAALPKRAQVRALVLERDDNRCQFWAHADAAADLDLPLACSWPELDVHEIIPRSAWVDGWLVPDNCITLCRRHHDWVGDNPDQAYVFGLHGYSHERPDNESR